MLRMRWLGAGLVVLALGGAVRAAEESPLAQVPASAPVVIHLRGFERARGRLLALLDKALPAEAARGARTGLEAALKKHFQGRTLKGLPANGSVFLVLTELPLTAEKPKLAFVVQVTDYAAFRDGLLKEDERKSLKADAAGIETTTIDGDPSYLVDRKGYAVLAAHKETATLFTRKQPGLDGKLSKEDAAKLLGADLSFYVDTVAVNKVYGKRIREGRAFVDTMLGHMILSHAGDRSTREMAKRMTDLLFQALEDSGLLLVCVEFPPQGLALHYRVAIRGGTKTHALLKTFKLSPFGQLTRLPSGQLGYTALQVEPALLEIFPTWLYGLSAGPGGEHKVIGRGVKQLAEAGPRARFSSVRLPGPEVHVWLYNDPAKAVKARLQILQALQAGDIFEGAVLKGKPEVPSTTVPHRGFQFHHASLSWDIDKMIATALLSKDLPAEQQKMQATILKKLIGEGKKIWFGTDGKLYLQVAARDWANARQRIDAYLDGKEVVGRQQAFRDTRKRLPAETTVLQMIASTAYVQMLGEFMQASVQATSAKPPVDFKMPSIATGKTAYLGMAFTLRPERGSLDVWVPATAVGQFYSMFEAILQWGEKAP